MAARGTVLGNEISTTLDIVGRQEHQILSRYYYSAHATKQNQLITGQQSELGE